MFLYKEYLTKKTTTNSIHKVEAHYNVIKE